MAIPLSPELQQRLDQVAKILGATKSNVNPETYDVLLSAKISAYQDILLKRGSAIRMLQQMRTAFLSEIDDKILQISHLKD